MAEIKSVCVRFYLNKPQHKKAYELLKNQTECKSTSAVIVKAVAAFFDNCEREDRLVEKIIIALSALPTAISSPSISENANEKPSEELIAEIDFDFLGG